MTYDSAQRIARESFGMTEQQTRQALEGLPITDPATQPDRDHGGSEGIEGSEGSNGGGTTGYRTVTLSQVQPEQVRWLWDRRIAAGKIAVLDGDPGVGKSTLATTIAAHLSTGREWPDGAPCPLGDTLMLSGEDGLADTVRPRFDAAGGDPSRFHVLDAVTTFTGDGDPVNRDPHLGDIAQLTAAVRDLGVLLIVVDVLMAFLPNGTDSHRDQDIRGVLRRLRDVAEDTGAAVLLLRHLNKSAGGAALYRGGGSIGIVGAARTGMLAARDPDDPSLIVVASTKNNLAPEAASLGYRLVDHDGAGRVEWAGVVERRADELLTSHGGEEDREERDALAAFLTDYLTDCGGVASAKDSTKAVAAAFGPVNKMALKRARDRARIVTTKGGMGAGWVWSLPEGNTEGNEGNGS